MKLLIALLLSATATACAQTLPLDGATLFKNYCAACHGSRGNGDGPMVSALKTKVPDLTLIVSRNGGTFPLDRVEAVISGDKLAGLSHGTREMPVWGTLFSADISGRDYGKLRVYNVAKYLEACKRSNALPLQ